jgi:Alcohol dehydrogenase GroES-like domain
MRKHASGFIRGWKLSHPTRFATAGSSNCATSASTCSTWSALRSRQVVAMRRMQVAGIDAFGGEVRMLELAAPASPALDEVVISVQAAGVGNWDEIVRVGDWDVGRRPPLALGVEVAGVVAAVGEEVTSFAPGDEVLTHPLPLRHQGAWAEWLVAPAALVARKPAAVPWEAAAVFPVPALTADQALTEAAPAPAGEGVLVHGAGGVTGGLVVQLAIARGATVVATAGPLERGARPRLRRACRTRLSRSRLAGPRARRISMRTWSRGRRECRPRRRGNRAKGGRRRRPPRDDYRRSAATRTRSHGRGTLRPSRRFTTCRTGRGTRGGAALAPRRRDASTRGGGQGAPGCRRVPRRRRDGPHAQAKPGVMVRRGRIPRGVTDGTAR